MCQCRRTEELLSILSFRDADDPGQVGGFHIRQINTQLVEIAGVIRRCCEWKARKAWCDQGGFWLDRILHAASYIGKDRNQLQCLSLATPNERCRWLEIAQQLRRSGRGFVRGRRGKLTRRQFEASFDRYKEVPFGRVCLNYGT